MIKNPWKTLSSKYVYSNNWIKVREDKVIRPDGKKGIYGVVETKTATGVVALDADNNIFLVGQYRYPLDVYSWEIIEGGAEDSESAIDAAKRELLEEAGIIAKSWQQLGGELHLSNCHSSETAYVFLAKDLEFKEPNPEGTEVLEIKKMPFKNAYKMMRNGEITDCLSIIALERARVELKMEIL